jgi:hypothetical protein
MNIRLEQTFPYIKDIITPTGKPCAVDVSKDAVQIIPNTVVILSPAAQELIAKGLISL